jgi:ectoine hydroxylase-related dioxygenase (phytanoyl-CoA dioxygenase family)
MNGKQVLSAEQIRQFRRTGHLTVPDVLDVQTMDTATKDVAIWGSEFVQTLSPEQRRWYLEQGAGEQTQLRKLDNPVFHRKVFRELAANSSLVEMVQQLIGQGVSVFFSQVFMKPPEVGGKKPIHQDNFYFGPNDPDATLTAWIALDDATTENGCLYYSNAHQSEIAQHVAPEGEPFNLQIPSEIADQFEMLPAPVPRGGVSFHHGNTPHQSSANRSTRPRRAAALHYMRSDTRLINPALSFDEAVRVKVT